MTPSPGISAVLIAMALLAGAHGRRSGDTESQASAGTVPVVRFAIAMLLIQSVVAAALAGLFPDWNPLSTAIVAMLPTALVPVCFRVRHPDQPLRVHTAARALAVASLMTLAAALSLGVMRIDAALHWLLSGCVLSWVYVIALPAQTALFRQLENDNVPSKLRGFPLRLLATAVLALALAGILPPW